MRDYPISQSLHLSFLPSLRPSIFFALHMNSDITIRPCTTLEEFNRCLELQKMVWGDTDRDLVPTHVLVVVKKTGGQLFGAYDGEKLVGYLLGLIGCRDNEVYIHSHMTGVHPDYQNCGIGRQLKLAQREDALQRGINRIEWTFDPLKLRNAYFNIARLGAIIRQYLPNVYGLTASHLDQGLPTDRLVAEWFIDSPRVKKILSGVKPSRSNEGQRIFVSASSQTGKQQAALREQFQKLFANGHFVSGLEIKDNGMEYWLEPESALKKELESF